MENDNKKVTEISDDKLEEASGGGNLTLHFFNTPEEVVFIFWVGDIIYVKENFFCKTVRCRVVDREVFYDPQYHCYEDAYIVRSVQEGSDLYTRILRDDVVNQAD